jgi:hypothetical protein
MARLEPAIPASTYVVGYNFESFEERHLKARAGKPMKRRHDCFSLAKLLRRWFQEDGLTSFVDALEAAACMTNRLADTSPNSWRGGLESWCQSQRQNHQ